MSTVRVKECTGNINDFLSSPLKNQSGLLCYDRNRNRLQILLSSKAKEFIHIPGCNYHCHSLLGFGDRKLGSVKTGILLGYLVKIYYKTVCQLTDRNGYTAGTKVVTFLNNLTYFSPTEESLNLTFCRCISLLYLCTAGLNGALRMYLGGAGSSAAAVTTGPSAQQDNDIVGIRILPDHICPGRCAHNSTNLHTLCNIVGVINFLHIAGSKTNLVAIGGITACCTSYQLLLGKLALQGICNGNGRICRTSHTHCLIDVASA